jgi:DNA recombination protein RmuC
MELVLVAVLLAVMLMVMIIILLRLPGGQALNLQINDLKNRLNELTTQSLTGQKDFYQSAQQMLNEVHNKLGSLAESSKHIEEIGKDISSLQNILRAPKLRGGFGEYLLEDLLKQIFPAKNYDIQYTFRSGAQVDAVIRLGDGIVPIDSKFPLESFQRFITAEEESQKTKFKREFIKSIRLRIDEIATKYINPQEGTFDFAMMYIPAENIFYEIIINDDLTNRNYEIFNYALERHVIPVSPNSFYAYLMAIVFGLKGFRIEQQAKQIMGELSKVQSTFADFYGDFTVIGRHIKNAAAKYEDGLKSADRFSERLSKVTGIPPELKPPDINSR